MNLKSKQSDSATSQAIEISIRLGIIFLIFAVSLTILMPFLSIVLWGAIIAVAIYKPFLALARKLGGNTKLAAILIALISVGVILVPVIMLSGSMIDGAKDISQQINQGTIHIAPPSEKVKDWPVIGERAYDFWQQASSDLSTTLKKYPEQLKTISLKLFGAATSLSLGILQFIISLLIATAFLTSAESVNRGSERFAKRLSTEHGEALLTMSVNTIRSVAVGVIGIAFLQAVFGGLGMMAVGVPAAGLLAGIILILAIAQLPPWLVLLPAIIYVYSIESSMVATIFMVWSIIVSFSDMFLKPIFLGRGVDAPMMVILLGAIGGMLTMGIVGLFIGAIILAVGYKLFQAWLSMGDSEDSAEEVPTEA